MKTIHDSYIKCLCSYNLAATNLNFEKIKKCMSELCACSCYAILDSYNVLLGYVLQYAKFSIV